MRQKVIYKGFKFHLRLKYVLMVMTPYGFLVLRPMLKKNLRAKAMVRAGNQCH